jgi:hypothetical protein
MDFSNTNNNADTDILVYKNGVLVYTWVIRAKRTAYDASVSVAFAQGDRCSVFAKKAATQNPGKVSVGLKFGITTRNTATGGTATL